MGDLETEFQTGASHAALIAELSSLQELLAEKDNQLSNLVDQLNDRNHLLTEQDKPLAGWSSGSGSSGRNQTAQVAAKASGPEAQWPGRIDAGE